MFFHAWTHLTKLKGLVEMQRPEIVCHQST